MRYTQLLLCCLLAIVIETQAQEIPPPPEGMAVVYFFRTSSLGAAINFSYFDSTRLIGRFNGPKYIRYECKPGAHLFWARSENKDFIEANLMADKTYFVLAIPQMGALKAGVALEPVDVDDIKTMEKISKLLIKRPPESFTPEELQEDSKDLEEVVKSGMERYEQFKTRGKAILKLEKPIK